MKYSKIVSFYRLYLQLIVLFFFCTLSCLAKKQGQERIDSLLGKLKNAKEDTNKIKILNDLSFTYYSVNPDQGIKVAEECKVLSEKLKWNRGIIDANSNLGVCYWMKSDLARALNNFFVALKICENVDDKQGLAIIENNIGLIYNSLEKYPQAINYFQKALKINTFLKNKASIIRNLINMSEAFSSSKDITKELEILEKALKLSYEIKDTTKIAICLTNIGSCYLDINNPSTGLDYLNKSLNLSNPNNSLYNGDNYYFIGKAHYMMGKDNSRPIEQKRELNKSIEFYKKATNCFLEVGSTMDLKKSYEDIYKVYKLLGNYQTSLDFFEKYTSIKDSVNSIESKQKILNLESQREIDLRDNHILSQELKINKSTRLVLIFIIISIATCLITGVFILLYIIKQKSIKILEGKNKIISEINASKDKFFSIIAHDLRNPLGNFREVTKLLHDEYYDFDEKERIDFLELMKISANNIYLLLENLLEWTRSQQGVITFNPICFNINKLYVDVVKPLKMIAEKKDIELINSIDNQLEINADINMFSTILRNLLSNALKFTSRGGKIEFGTIVNSPGVFKALGKNIIFFVKDNGIGMNSDIVSRLFKIDENVSRPGTEKEPSTGLGLLLCKEFVEKNGGKIWVESEKDHGSTFYFSIPK